MCCNSLRNLDEDVRTRGVGLNYWYRYKLPILIIGLEKAYLEMPLAAIACIFFALVFFFFFGPCWQNMVFMRYLEVLFLLVVN